MLNRFRAVLLVLLVLVMAAVGPGQAAELTAREIMDRVDGNQYLGSAHLVSKLIIKTGRREVVKEMESWVIGSEKALTEFFNPADRGTKYLKLGDELWMFFPDAEDLVKISGHMLKQGMMGSDFSYQDALESEKMAELYRFELEGTDTYEGVKCYVIKATALPDKKVSYALRKMWVDSERFVVLKEELYAASGKLMKVAWVEEIAQKDGRTYASKLVMQNKLRRGSSTTLVVEDIDFDVEIPAEMFSLRRLMR